MAVGKKAQAYFRFRHQPVEQQFVGMSDRPSFEDARRVAAAVLPPFLRGEVDLVQIVSWRILSASRQFVETRQLLPVIASKEGAGDGPAAAPTNPLGRARIPDWCGSGRRRARHARARAEARLLRVRA